MYKRQKLILRNLETQKLDELCLILTGVALVATIFLAPHHNRYALPNNDVDSVMLKVYREWGLREESKMNGSNGKGMSSDDDRPLQALEKHHPTNHATLDGGATAI